LCSVNTFAALVAPTVVDGKVAVAGVNAAWTLPVPDKDTVCGLLEPLSEMESVPVRAPAAVGLKTTSIWQLFPGANVAPQVVDFSPKLALTVMLEISRVTLPPLLSVAAFAALVASTMVAANARELGETLIPVASGLTVTLTEVAPVKLPDTPEIPTLNVPVAAEPVAVRVSVLVVVVGLGLNDALTPLGRPEADSVTLPLKPPPSVTVIVVVVLLPCASPTLPGEAASEKPGP